uniref:Uncharacterized protein n=1 Tax=Solanum lycopersicum TaxID=4081 RepID=A0A3Q7ED38_SOLLC
MTSVMEYPHVPWEGKTIGRRRPWHVIIALGQHTRSDDVACVMLSLPWDRTHGQTASGVACNHIPSTAHTVERHRVCHAIIVFGLHTQSDDVRHVMQACPLGSKHGRTTPRKACHHHPWTTYKVSRCRAWHVIIAVGQNTQLEDV